VHMLNAQTGPEHRRHRNAVKGSFGEGVMERGWEVMVKAVSLMIKEEGLGNGMGYDVVEAMRKITFIVIVTAGFGVEVPWEIPETKGPLLPLPESISVFEHNLPIQILFPPWLLPYMPFASLRRIGNALDSLHHHFTSIAQRKRAELKQERAALQPGEKMKFSMDLLGALVAAQIEGEESGVSGAGLTETELISNMLLFFVAGHETTSNTLVFTLRYLSLYPEWQEEILKEIESVCGPNMPEYRDMPNLPLTLAATFETLRLRDQIMILPKLCDADTTIPYTTWSWDGEVTHHLQPVKKGDHVVIDIGACGVNPFEWTDPYVFNPRRWLNNPALRQAMDKGKENFLSFSAGVRVCIGRRFAEVEMVAAISHILRQFKISPVMKEGERRDAMVSRMMKGKEQVVYKPGEFEMRFDKR